MENPLAQKSQSRLPIHRAFQEFQFRHVPFNLTVRSNGTVEGFVNKVEWIKRSSNGQAGFPLLQRRVLLHPASRATHREDETLAA